MRRIKNTLPTPAQPAARPAQRPLSVQLADAESSLLESLRRIKTKAEEAEAASAQRMRRLAENGHHLDWSSATDLLTNQARSRVLTRLLGNALEMLDSAPEEERTDMAVKLVAALQKSATELVTRRAMGLSRSTNVMSNAIDDAEAAVAAEFLRDLEYELSFPAKQVVALRQKMAEQY